MRGSGGIPLCVEINRPCGESLAGWLPPALGRGNIGKGRVVETGMGAGLGPRPRVEAEKRRHQSWTV